MRSLWLRLLVVTTAVCALSIPSSAARGQDQTQFDPVDKTVRDLPFPALVAAEPGAAAAAAPAVLPQVVPQAVEAAGAADVETTASPSSDVGRWSRLAYQSFQKDNWEIILANGDGSQPINLTQDRGADARPQLNRDGTRVVFYSDRAGNIEVYTVNADGMGLNRLTFNHADDFAPTWSPDGARIVFVSNRTGNNELFLMNADGSALTQLTFDGTSDNSPAWSPDGKWIAWKRTTGAASSILMMHPDGSEFTVLAKGLAYAGNLNWSPASDELITDADIDGDYWNELVGIHFHWGAWEAYLLADANQSFVDLWAGVYAPDGGSVAYTFVQYGVKNRKLVLQRADLLRSSLISGETVMIPGFGADMDPSWANIDWSAPTSQVAPLPPFVHAGRVPVHLEGADSGPSGIHSFDVQYGSSPDGPWVDLASGLTSAEVYLPSLEPGAAIWLRSRARDFAGNLEAWPPTADAGTRIYAWEVRGRGVDNHGIFVPNGSVTSSPDALNRSGGDKNGGYRLLYTVAQTYTVGMVAPGYAAGAPSALKPSTDIRLDLFVPPVTELVQNGGLEDGLNGWTGDGVVVQGGLTDGAHSGSRGLLLGSDCAVHCLEGPVSVDMPQSGWAVQALDAQGNFHVLQVVANGQLRYRVRSLAAGTWSEPEIVQLSLPAANSWIYVPAIAVDGGGTVHVLALVHTPEEVTSSAYSEYTLWYGQKAPGGTWTPFTRMANRLDVMDDEIIMEGDPTAGVHVLVDKRFYFHRAAQGDWSPAVDIFAGMAALGLQAADLAVGSDGVVHFIGNPDSTLIYRSLPPQGELSTPLEIGPAGSLARDMLDIEAGPNGTVHVVMGPYYRTRDEAGLWTDLRLILPDDGYSIYKLQVDGGGRLHVFSQSAFPPTVYLLRTADTGWSTRHLLDPDVYLGTYNLTVSRSGVIQLLSPDFANNQLFYWSSPLGSTGVISTASQVVTLPAQMVHPTLSFFHKALSGDPAGEARLSVAIDDGTGSGATTVYSTSAATSWTQASVDMAQWLGKTVTVTFAVKQADAEPLLSVYLDDISLGPWTTPVIREVTPAQLYASWDGAQLTVRGDNFTGGSTVRLGDTALPITFGDEHTLQATIPAGLPAGRYDLWVQNPDGQQNVAPGGLTLGGWGYLPEVRK